MTINTKKEVIIFFGNKKLDNKTVRYLDLDTPLERKDILNCKLSLDLQNVRPSIRTTISPAVFIGFFQYRTQGIITMSRASWKKLLFFSGHFRAVKKGLKI